MTSSSVSLHHIKYFSNKEPWEYANEYLETLCEKCHNERHNISKAHEHNIDFSPSETQVELEKIQQSLMLKMNGILRNLLIADCEIGENFIIEYLAPTEIEKVKAVILNDSMRKECFLSAGRAQAYNILHTRYGRYAYLEHLDELDFLIAEYVGERSSEELLNEEVRQTFNLLKLRAYKEISNDYFESFSDILPDEFERLSRITMIINPFVVASKTYNLNI